MSATTYNLAIEQGSTFKLRLRPSSATLDFTGSTGKGQIRRSPSDPTVLAEFTVSTGTDGTGFYLDFLLTAAQTAAIPVPATASKTRKSATYMYDIELTLADGRVIRMIQGEAVVSPEVTK